MAYLYLGSGIDDALALKVTIPVRQKAAFLNNEIFKSGDKKKPSIQIGNSEVWWKIDDLKERSDRSQKLSKSQYLACTLGSENGQWIAYIS